MLHADNAQALIKKLVPLFETQGQCVEAVKAGYREYRGAGNDRRSKVRAEKVFEAIKEYCQDFRKEHRKPPTKYNVAKEIEERFQISKSRAKTYVHIYVLWYLKGFGQLSAKDHARMEKDYPAVWKPFLRNHKFLLKQFDEIKALTREHVQAINERVAAQPQPAVAVKKRNRGKVINSKEELFKLLGLS